ncbi:serine/threonine protein phosphatase [Halovenus sp. WSH3]|uniref:Serine/threonine protein phosphatase n=1 Tax=Halovenus carboxidivorans TaxID=2692199 RepID=A0A6B0TCV1_9EURY|nr:metallophosphoesterase family protein [Halovenus carboxidivorans]MXR53061.1 serine/threonine protein phosphatase [Halovenus carboxidivorans]
MSPPEFSDSVEALHRRFDPDQYDGIYVVGDVHGCIDELRTLWARLDPSADDLVLFVGDLVRKGPDSTAVVEFVHQRENAVSVRGNNEAKIIHERIDTDPFAGIEDAVASFPLVVTVGDAMVVHGGVDPTRPLRAHSPDDLLEMRSVPPSNGYDGPFWFQQYDGPRRICFGHTVLGSPFVSEHAVGLDTGCVYGGSLTAYDLRSGDVASVPAEATYQQRSSDKILDVSPE